MKHRQDMAGLNCGSRAAQEGAAARGTPQLPGVPTPVSGAQSQCCGRAAPELVRICSSQGGVGDWRSGQSGGQSQPWPLTLSHDREVLMMMMPVTPGSFVIGRTLSGGSRERGGEDRPHGRGASHTTPPSAKVLGGRRIRLSSRVHHRETPAPNKDVMDAVLPVRAFCR